RQHHRRQAGHSRFVLHPSRGFAASHYLFDDGVRWTRTGRCARPLRHRTGPFAAGTAQETARMKRVPMTAPGAQRLRAELENLKSVKRPQIINAIAEARA